MESRQDYVRCITIVHPLHEIRKYRELSAFFRFLGIFVCENITGKEYGDPTDHIIRLEEGSDWDTQISIENVVRSMEKLFSTSAMNVLLKVADVFKNNDLMRSSYAIAYFADTVESYIYKKIYESYDHFKEALQALEKIGDDTSVDGTQICKYILIAKSNCKRRMNELYTIIWNALEKGKLGEDDKEKQELKEELWKRTYYSYEDVNKDITAVLEEFPDFYSAYAVRGFTAELDDDHRFNSVADLLSAERYIGERSYASYILYRIGRYYEVIRDNLDEKWKYYEKSWKADPRNYRALYKLAIYAQELNDVKREEELFERILEILEEKKDSPALQTIECAYLFKAFTGLGNLYIKRGDILQGIEYLKKAIAVYENEKNTTGDAAFYPWMFGDESVETEGKHMWKIYKDAAKSKLKIDAVYRVICEVTAETGLTEVYEEYYHKLIE